MEREGKEIMTVKEVATYLKMNERTVYRLVRSGKIPSAKIIGQWRIIRGLLDRWLEEASRRGADDAERTKRKVLSSRLGKESELAYSDALELIDLPLASLLTLSNEARRRFTGSSFELCSITNAKSGMCSEDCKFCSQSSRYSTEAPIYPLKEKSKIVGEAKRAKEIGARRFGIVTSGKTISAEELRRIADTIDELKRKVEIDICASLGILSTEQLSILKEAGLSRYHHNIEMSPEFFSRIISTHSIQERVNTIKKAKELGLEVCSGGIIGMGESWKDRLEMAYLLKDLDVDSIPINILIPIKGTPLESSIPLPALDAIRTICIFRLVLRDKTIKIAAGREHILKDFQGLAFLAGANGMLIGGYLTIKGRAVDEDWSLVREIERVWT